MKVLPFDPSARPRLNKSQKAQRRRRARLTDRPAPDDPAWRATCARVLAVGACRHCGSSYRLTVDHILPLVRGGTNDPINLQCLCRACNKAKGSSLPPQDRDFLLARLAA